MTLIDTVNQLAMLDDELIICACRPWTAVSQVRLVRLDEEHRLPKEILRDGFEYFLGVALAKETLEIFGDRPSTDEQKLDCLIYYASEDAYPNWIYAL